VGLFGSKLFERVAAVIVGSSVAKTATLLEAETVLSKDTLRVPTLLTAVISMAAV
jgi:hypothetical protein